jgi:phenylalanyl-tRNA synthetase alpha chain
MLERIDQLDQQAQADLAEVHDAAALEQFRLKYLAGSGALKKLMALLKDLPADQKPVFGQRANDLRTRIQAAFAQRQTQVSAAGPGASGGAAPAQAAGGGIDVTEPGAPPRLGRAHIITQTIDALIEVFGRMGFDVATGPEVEDEWHNFVALNIPPEHPARDPLDNFYLRPAAAPAPQAASGAAGTGIAASTAASSSRAGGVHLLRSQTSTIQVRVMEQTRPPVRIVAMGRVYRPDEHDATHYSMFHQVEGLYVNRRVSMADLKTTLLQFAHAYFGPDTQVRLRPSFFPFTEPSAELDVKINLQGEWRWMELGGCGMVDPNVFEAVGYDPEKWTGFAFGLGIERLAMRKYGIPDLRWMFENDVRFLRQF